MHKTITGGGYLTRHQEAHILLDVPPPKTGSAQQKRDQQIFLDTRKLEGSARWQQAIYDNKLDAPTLTAGFQKAIVHPLPKEKEQAFNALLIKTHEDTARLVRHSKKLYRQPRPNALYGGKTCVPTGGYDYPSGHAMAGWTTALLLTELYPERKKQIFAHARHFGQSRVICGVHSMSAVEIDEYYAKKIFEKIKQKPSFKRDLEKLKTQNNL